jgi:hypothetical protein
LFRSAFTLCLLPLCISPLITRYSALSTFLFNNPESPAPNLTAVKK